MNHKRSSRAGAVLLVALLVGSVLLSAAVVPASGAEAGDPSGSPAVGSGGPVLQQDDADASENETPARHANPDEANEDGDGGAVESHLATQLSRRLGDSAVQLEEGEADQARQLLGDDFSSSLAKYAEVADESGNNESAERFRKAQKDQEEYASTVQEYRETYKEYQEAKENGDDQRARELARELNRLAEKTNRTSNELNESFGELGKSTSGNFSQAQNGVNEVQSNISAQQKEVNDAEFERTELAVEAEDDTASFSDPLRLSGSLTTEDDEPIADESVTFQVGEQNYTSTTDEDGDFSLSYRPVAIPQNASNVTVTYLPKGDTLYLGSNATVDLDVEQEDAAVELDDVPEEVAFGEQVAVTGTATIDGEPVRSAPVTLAVDGRRLGTVVTDEKGQFVFEKPLPADVATGERSLTAGSANDSLAVVAEPAEANVTVEPTPTNLTLSASSTEGGEVTVDGHLTLANGTSVDGQTVELQADGKPVGTVQTTVNGTYQGTVALPSDVQGRDQITIAAVYANQGTNLADSRASTGVPLAATGPAEDLLSWDALSQVEKALVLFIPPALITLLVLAYRRWRGGQSGNGSRETSETTPDTDERGNHPTPTDPSGFSIARERLIEGDADGAVEAAYVAARRRIAADFDVSQNGTHWEFYRACQTHDLSDRFDTLQQLTEQYERAAYHRESTAMDRARETIELAVALVPSGDRTSTDGGQTSFTESEVPSDKS
ncbi:hypothetical protein [Halegenticoccus tardaugens]|uniref:hypothetical protein n=1 Tax=Halegenticoccus tardaugens TaxID=2071624 RepID=UPI00100AA1EA|nr:hypothetical protein [Halegenticoccus tardaugens]